jgi:hypothetical protein
VKKLIAYTVLTFLFFTMGVDILFAQQPGINLEAIARDKNNNPAKDRKIYVHIDIIPALATNAPAFSEEHITRTNNAGIFNISVGKGTRVGGVFNNLFEIPWNTLNYLVKIKVAIEPILNVVNWNYQNEWVEIGTTPFGIVPYAGTALTANRIADNAAVTSISGGVTGLTPAVASTGNVILGGVLNIASGGTGSSIKNFIDLSTNQNIAGEKTFSQKLSAGGGLSAVGYLSLSGLTSPLLLNGASGNSGEVLVSQGAGSTPTWVNLQAIIGIKSKNRSSFLTSVETFEINVTGLDDNDGISVVLEANAAQTSIPGYYIFRDTNNSKVKVHFSAPYSGYVSWVIVE